MFIKNSKNLLSIVAIVTFIAVQFFLPFSQGATLAEGTVFDNLEMNQRVQVRNLAIVMTTCYGSDNTVSPEEMRNGRWFAGGNMSDSNVVANYIVEPVDGVVNCAGDDAGWVALFMKLAGYGSLEEAFNAVSVPKAANSNDPNGTLKPENEIKQILNTKFGTDIFNLGSQDYLTYRSNFWDFVNTCQAQEITSGSNAGLTANIYKVVDGVAKSQLYSYSNDKEVLNVIGAYQGARNGDIQCSELVGYLATKSHADAYVVALNAQMTATGKTQAEVEGGNGAGGGGGDTTTAPDETCEGGGIVMNFIVCPISRAADEFTSFVTGALSNLLRVGDMTNDVSGIKQGWASMRVIASSLIVLVALVMIASQIFSFDFMSAYTIKKVLPRLIAAAILIQLSWILMTTMIIFVNALGDGIAALLYLPWPDLGDAVSNGTGLAYIFETFAESYSVGAGTYSTAFIIAGFGAAAGWGAVGGMFGLLFAAIGIVLACLVAFVTLVLRKVLILALLVIAPLALVAWILPGTQKWWDKWWDMWSKLLLMFPLIIGLLTIGTIAAYLVAASGTGVIGPAGPIPGILTDPNSAPQATVAFFIILICFFGPFFFIPSMMKLGGTILAKASQYASSGGDALKKARPIRNIEKARDNNKASRDYNAQLDGKRRASGNTYLGSKPGIGRVVRGYGRVQAGTGGAKGAYKLKFGGTEDKAMLDNARAEWGEATKGLGHGAMMKEEDTILDAELGSSVSLNGKTVRVTEELQRIALYSAANSSKNSAAIKRYRDGVRKNATAGGPDVAKSSVERSNTRRVYDTFLSGSGDGGFGTVDSMAPDLARGNTGDTAGSDSALAISLKNYGSLKGDKVPKPVPAGSPPGTAPGAWGYNSRHEEVVNALNTKLTSPDFDDRKSAAIAINQFAQRSDLGEIDPDAVALMGRLHGGEAQKVISSGGNLRLDVDAAGVITVKQSTDV